MIGEACLKNVLENSAVFLVSSRLSQERGLGKKEEESLLLSGVGLDIIRIMRERERE